MKRNFVMMLLLSFVLVLAACSPSNNTTETSTNPDETVVSEDNTTNEETSNQDESDTADGGQTIEESENTGAQESGNFTVENIELLEDGYKIPAVVTLPADSQGPVPVVVMLHGTASNKDEAGNGYVYMSELLAENGIGSVRFDFAGSGDSDRDYQLYTIEGAVDDTEEILDYIEENKDIFDENRIGLMGWSQGGYIAMLAAEENDEIKSLVTWAGTTDMSDMVTDEEYQTAKADGFFVRQYDWRDDTKVSLEWIEQAKSINVIDEFKDYTGPVLAINGANDDVVNPEEANLIVGASSNPQSKVEIVEGADHTFNIFTGDLTQFEQTEKLTLDWFKDTLK